MTCTVAGCDRPRRRQGPLCGAHYTRMLRHGDVRASVPLRPYKDLRAQLLTKIDQTSAAPCWLWTGSVAADGYGYVNAKAVHRTPTPAYRAVFAALRGPIPAGMQLDHRCHTDHLTCPGGSTCLHRRCVNPDHLEPVSAAENARRRNTREYA